jgi:predicted MFS family arabinose efflux permease
MSERKFLDGEADLGPRHNESWGGVLAMSLCVFALIASEFMPVSLLTPISAALKVSEGMAGQGITISGVFAVLTSLSIASVAARANRRTLLLSLTAMMCVSGAVVALASNFATYMAGRALLGIVIGGFWSMSAATVMRLVPASKVTRALAMLNGGNALATVVAPPLGSFIGAIANWRTAFFCLVPIGALAFAWQWFSLPSLEATMRSPATRNVFGLLRTRSVALGMLGVGTFFMGQFTLFTYLRPFLETVTGVGASTLSLELLTVGVSGFVGTAIVGSLLRFGMHGILVGIPVLMAGVAVALVQFGTSVQAVTLFLAIWGLISTAAPVAWWTWLARELPRDAETGGGLMVAVVQLSIAAGSTFGGTLFDRAGYQATFLASAGLLVAAALVAWSMTQRWGAAER